MYVLGVGGFMHDYNCCLVDVKKQKVAICEAERISRRKHHTIQDDDDIREAILVCCKDLGCRLKDISTVIFSHTDDFACKEKFKRLFKRAEFHSIDHHLCHVAAGFYSSPYDKASILSIDGFGDGSSGLLAVGDGTDIQQIERISEQDSIGLEYLRATIHLGLGGYGSEGKTQGLAPYGEPILYDRYMNEIQIVPSGNIKLSKALQGEGERLAREGNYLNSELLYNTFLNDYCHRRINPEPLEQRHFNLASSIQKVLENVMLELSLIAKRKASSNNLVLSGGVCLNSSANGKILDSAEFDSIFALPQASDRGLGLGAALYYVHHMQKVPRFFQLEDVFYGQEFSDREAIKAMKKGRLDIDKTDSIAEYAAESLSRGEIVGWFQGRSEVGARALGHRSILADPRKADMKNIINERVKHREWFRPFAPAVLDNYAAEYFQISDMKTDLSLMTFTVQAKESGILNAPATTHIDQTARIQTVDAARNEKYAKVLEGFLQRTGVPIILNTSFNDNGEPIVESPDNAVRTFLNSDMDVLCIGNIVGRKR